MTQHTFTVKLNGSVVSGLENAAMYSGTEESPIELGDDVADMYYESSTGILAGLVFDDFIVSKYTP